MNKQDALGYLTRFHQTQYQHNYRSEKQGRLSDLGNWLRYWFGFYQDSQINKLSKYLNTLKNEQPVDIIKIKATLEKPTNEKTPLANSASLSPGISHLLSGLQTADSMIVTADNNADLETYPTATRAPTPSTQLTVGDLHGNAIKLIYFLIREAAVTGIDELDYAKLHRIYNTPVNRLTEKQLNEFNQIIGKMKLPEDPEKRAGLVRMIGDTLADRGNNDYFTLQVLQQLKLIGLPLEVVISNHDIGFVSDFELPDSPEKRVAEPPLHLADTQEKSMENLAKLLNRSSLSATLKTKMRSDIAQAITTYQDSLKLLNYALSPDGKTITLYTHAPVGLETIAAIAAKFGISYKDESAKELAATIDAINQAVRAQGGIRTIYSGIDTEDTTNPFHTLIWNRYQDKRNLDRPFEKGSGDKQYHLHFVHGHDHSNKTPLAKNVTNLDSDFGKLGTKTPSAEVCKQYKKNGTLLDLRYLSHQTETTPAPKLSAIVEAAPDAMPMGRGLRREAHFHGMPLSPSHTDSFKIDGIPLTNSPDSPTSRSAESPSTVASLSPTEIKGADERISPSEIAADTVHPAHPKPHRSSPFDLAADKATVESTAGEGEKPTRTE